MPSNEEPPPDREKLTFAQAEGRVPLPRQLALRELPRAVTAPLWAFIYESVLADEYQASTLSSRRYIGGAWREVLLDLHVAYFNNPVDEFNDMSDEVIGRLKHILTQGDYVDVLGFIEFVARHPKAPAYFADGVNSILTARQAAYRVEGRTIVPVASDAEANAVRQAFADLAGTKFRGAETHLTRAAKALTAGDYAASVRESIHSVEAVARVLTPDAKTLGPALAKLEKGGRLHPALKAGFEKLYGFTSDEKGIRHALLDAAEAAVDETDALYMFGACAAFVSYLIRRS